MAAVAVGESGAIAGSRAANGALLRLRPRRPHRAGTSVEGGAP